MGDVTFGQQLGQQMATQAAGDAVGTIFGLGLEGHNDRRQLRQQRKLQNLQMEGQMAMTDYNMTKQLQMWKDTSYGPQMEQMRKAGINPALMYGISGGGGQTTGQANGQVTGANAPQGGREIMDKTGQTLQYALLDAQRRNIEADTSNKQAENPNIPIKGKNIEASTGNLQAGTANLVQQTDNLKTQKAYTEAQTALTEIQNDIQGSEINDMKAAIRYGMRKLYAEMQSAEAQSGVDQKTADTKVKQAKASLALTTIDAWLKSEQGKSIKQDVIESISRVKTMFARQEMASYDQRQGDSRIRQEQEKIDYNTAVPPELKELLDNIFIVPTTSGKSATKHAAQQSHQSYDKSKYKGNGGTMIP